MSSNGRSKSRTVSVIDLRIDPRLHPEEPRVPWLKKLKSGWDWLLYEHIIVSERQDGGLYVIAGRHRTMTAQDLKIHKLPAIVHTGLTFDQEVRLRVQLQDERRHEGALEKFLVEQQSPHYYPITDEITNTLYDYGFIVGNSHSSGNQIKAVATLQRIYRLGGTDLLEQVLKAVGFYSEDGIQIPGVVMQGAALVMHNYTVSTGERVDPEVLSAKLRPIGTKELQQRASRKAQQFATNPNSRADLIAEEMALIYNKGVRGKQRLVLSTPEARVMAKMAQED